MSEYDWNSDNIFSVGNDGKLNAPAVPPQETVPVEDPAADAAEFPASVSREFFAEGETSVPQEDLPPVEQPLAAPAWKAPSWETDDELTGKRAVESEELGSAASAPNEAGCDQSGFEPHTIPHTAAPEARQTVRPAAEKPQTAKYVQEKRSGGIGKRIVALALVCALLGGIVGAGGFWLASKAFGSSSGTDASASLNPVDGTGKSITVQQGAPRDTNAVQTVQIDRGQLMTASQVYKASVNSTVGITTEITTTNYWGQSTAAAAGSGFILTADGYILTNQHVIDKARSITVAMYDGTTYPAELVGYDVNNDIAVLKIDAKDLTPVVLGDSDRLEVGDEVIAIGNPLGELTFSLTKGNVSALNRAVTLSSKVTMNLIQTDTAINSGNSGGALFNMYGEVIGITNAKYSSSAYSGEASIDNIGFAIPINSVRDIVTSIIEKGYISKPYIGVSVGNVSEESQSYGMPQGCAIRSVEADSPAAKAGLQANDIVTAVNGTEITSYEEFAQLITDSGIGAELELTVFRKGETLTLKVTVGEKIQEALPDPAENQSEGQQSGENTVPWGGNGSDPWGGGFPWGWGFGW